MLWVYIAESEDSHNHNIRNVTILVFVILQQLMKHTLQLKAEMKFVMF